MYKSRLVKFGLMLCVFGLASAQRVRADDEALDTIFENLPGAVTKQNIWDGAAELQSTAGPKYGSTALETKDFEGFFVPAQDSTELWVFSDDGVDVYITDYSLEDPAPVRYLNRKGVGQTLASWQNQSLWKVNFDFGANKVYGVRVEYRNSFYHGITDIDGCTLFATNGGGQVVPVTVTFDPDPVRTGFTKPLGDSTIVRSVTATVVPKEITNDIDISRDGPTPPEVKIQNLERDTETGKITFDVKGLKGTPVAFPNGRTTIQAKYDGDVVGEVKAIVYVPKDIQTPHPVADSDVDPVNLCADNGTSPRWQPPLFETQCALVTHWSQWMTITVDDQWGNTLNDIYEGVDVEELYDESWWDINQDMTAGGTYQDPVSLFRCPPIYIVLKTSDAAQNWPAPPPPPTLPMGSSGSGQQRIDIKVGGHQVGKVKRDVTWTPPNHIKVDDAN